MTRKEFEDKVDAVAAGVGELIKVKNKQYGHDNPMKCFGHGVYGIHIRLEDKINRLDSILQTDAPEDTTKLYKELFYDIAGYALIALILLVEEEKIENKS